MAFLFLEIFVLALTISKDSNRGMSNMNEKKSAGETNACVSTCHEASQGTAASGSHDKTVPRPIIRGPASQVEKAGMGLMKKKPKKGPELKRNSQCSLSAQAPTTWAPRPAPRARRACTPPVRPRRWAPQEIVSPPPGPHHRSHPPVVAGGEEKGDGLRQGQCGERRFPGSIPRE